ncbi:hypothetical protein OG331_43510 [Streptomyces sp. NBC_01017]|uniref:hypothetical protein n=1 Tax=Streptomyces sp. NBC_01017 TaxID=2903721 RepID=UPI0038668A10|nr:hypothetical protein OG331_43510 [Streptomyces sp. NBC_01017]
MAHRARLRQPPVALALSRTGSGESARGHVRTYPDTMDVLAYFEAARATSRVRAPVQATRAQFGTAALPVRGLWGTGRAMAVGGLEAGHYAYDGEAEERRR